MHVALSVLGRELFAVDVDRSPIDEDESIYVYRCQRCGETIGEYDEPMYVGDETEMQAAHLAECKARRS